MTTTGTWLFSTQNDLLRSYALHNPALTARKLHTLKVQVFIFHHSRLLLLLLQKSSKPSSEQWTAPSTLTAYDAANPQTLYRIVVRMLKQAIEERKFHDLQFSDLASDKTYVVEQWKDEDQENIKTLQLNLILTTEGEVVGDRTAVECSVGFSGMEWFEFEEARKLELVELPLPRLERVFEKLRSYTSRQDRAITILQANPNHPRVLEVMENLIRNAALIKLNLQTVDRGFPIPHAILLIRKDEEYSPLFITEVTKEIDAGISKGHQEVSVRIPLPGRKSQMTRYVVIGKMTDKIVGVKPGLTVAMVKGVMREEGRLRVKWLHWNEGVKLETKVGGVVGGEEKT